MVNGGGGGDWQNCWQKLCRQATINQLLIELLLLEEQPHSSQVSSGRQQTDRQTDRQTDGQMCEQS